MSIVGIGSDGKSGLVDGGRESLTASQFQGLHGAPAAHEIRRLFAREFYRYNADSMPKSPQPESCT